MQEGDTTDVGRFFRNLKKEHVAKRYPGDDDQSPVYGFKLHKKHWKYADYQQGPLSVNLLSCIHTAECSIAIHPTPDDYYHVAIIDLEALNRLECLTSKFVAQYKPAREFKNLCHFEILPTDGTVLKWMELGILLDEPFPPASKLPTTPSDCRQAKDEYEKYRSIFEIKRWVRCGDGTLHSPQNNGQCHL